jgi:hypothetical protein
MRADYAKYDKRRPLRRVVGRRRRTEEEEEIQGCPLSVVLGLSVMCFALVIFGFIIAVVASPSIGSPHQTDLVRTRGFEVDPRGHALKNEAYMQKMEEQRAQKQAETEEQRVARLRQQEDAARTYKKTLAKLKTLDPGEIETPIILGTPAVNAAPTEQSLKNAVLVEGTPQDCEACDMEQDLVRTFSLRAFLSMQSVYTSRRCSTSTRSPQTHTSFDGLNNLGFPS